MIFMDLLMSPTLALNCFEHVNGINANMKNIRHVNAGKHFTIVTANARFEPSGCILPTKFLFNSSF